MDCLFDSYDVMKDDFTMSLLLPQNDYVRACILSWILRCVLYSQISVHVLRMPSWFML